MFYLTTQTTHFIYGIWHQTYGKGPLRKREETCCCHMGYSFQLAARVLLYASSHRQDNTYHGLCYTCRGALAATRNSSMGPPWRIDPTTQIHILFTTPNKQHIPMEVQAKPMTTPAGTFSYMRSLVKIGLPTNSCRLSRSTVMMSMLSLTTFMAALR